MAGLVPSLGPINRFNDLFGGGWTTDLHYLVSLGKWKEETQKQKRGGSESLWRGHDKSSCPRFLFNIRGSSSGLSSHQKTGDDDGLDK